MLGLEVLILVLLAIAAWLFGSFGLRVVGWLIMVVAVVTLPSAFMTGAWLTIPLSIVLFAVGAGLWLAGHWLHAYKKHMFRSGVAQRLLSRGRGRLDPTRGWGVPVHVVSEENR